MDATKFKTVDEYFATLPKKAVTALQKMRSAIKKAAPEAEEVISYNMPAFRQEGMLVYYAAWKEHVGLYPASPGMSVFDNDLEKYERSKGTIRFPLDEPLPLDLISRIVKFRVQENVEKKLAKTKKK